MNVDTQIRPWMGHGWVLLVIVAALAAVVAALYLSRRRTHGDRTGKRRAASISPKTELIEPSPYTVGVAQTKGARPDQEDSCMVSDWQNSEAVQRRGLLAAIADGMDSLGDGRVASRALMRCFGETFAQMSGDMPAMEKLLELTARGQQEVLGINRSGKPCGTTLAAVLIEGGTLSTLSVGDSRIALYRAGALLQLNREHVSGQGRKDGHRRCWVTSYIGMEGFHLMDRTLNPIRLMSGDRVLLMSPGVFETLDDDAIVQYLDRWPQSAAEAIVQAVKKRAEPHQDNATVVIVGLDCRYRPDALPGGSAPRTRASNRITAAGTRPERHEESKLQTKRGVE